MQYPQNGCLQQDKKCRKKQSQLTRSLQGIHPLGGDKQPLFKLDFLEKYPAARDPEGGLYHWKSIVGVYI